MTTSFRLPFTVLKRNFGYWSNGQYFPDDTTGQQIIVMATVQEPSQGDMNRIEAHPWGKRDAKYIKIYTDTRLSTVNQAIDGLETKAPGDIFYFDNLPFLLFGESNFTMLARSRQSQVSHWRYYACELIEGFQLENAP
jgi:hypothetical protein